MPTEVPTWEETTAEQAPAWEDTTEAPKELPLPTFEAPTIPPFTGDVEKTLRTPTQVAFAPLVNLAPTPGQIVAGARGFAPAGTDYRQAFPPMTEEQVAKRMKESPAAASLIGGAQALGDIDNFFVSPAGLTLLATSGLSAIPAGLHRAVALGFAAQMASQTPEIAREIGTELGKPENERDYQKISRLTVNAIANTGFTAAGAVSALGPRPRPWIQPRGRFPGSVRVEPPGVPPGQRLLEAGQPPIDIQAEVSPAPVLGTEIRIPPSERLKNIPILLPFPGFEPVAPVTPPEKGPSEREVSPPSALPPVVGQPPVGVPEKQAEGGAPQRGGEGEEGQAPVQAETPKPVAPPPLPAEMQRALDKHRAAIEAGQESPYPEIEADANQWLKNQPAFMEGVKKGQPDMDIWAANEKLKNKYKAEQAGVPTVPTQPAPPVAPPAPSPPAEAEAPIPSTLKAADEIFQHLTTTDQPLTKQIAHDIMAKHHGGTMAEGKFTSKDQSDVIEMAVNRYINSRFSEFDPGTATAEDAKVAIQDLKALLGRLPTQTTRTGETDKMQQFSTVPTEAFAANWVANLTPNDNVLEPSAGLAGLAVFAKNAGAHVTANELSPRRRALLEQTGLADQVLPHNAEMLHALMDPAIKAGTVRQPTVVVMNPPFSRAAQSDIHRTSIGAKHVEEALKLLKPGGRLVAIVGEGMAMGKPTFVPWWNKIAKAYNIRANVTVSGEEYRKYGTTFDNQILVIDKSGPTSDLGKVVTGRAEKVEDLIPMLESIRNDRPTVESAPTQPSGITPTAPGGTSRIPQPPPRPIPGPTGIARPPGGTPTGVGPRPQGGGGLQPQPGTPTVSPGPSTGLAGPAVSPEPTAPQTQPEHKPLFEGGDAGITVEQKQESERELSDIGVFSEYKPQKVHIPGAQPHPTPLVEPTAMAAVEPVNPKYTPNLPKELIEKGGLSDSQLEQIVYAGQSHEQFLPTGERQGYFVGDGTGVGKGRIISGMVIDNWNKGRRRHIWVSKDKGLIKDAKRDLGDLDFDLSKVIDMNKSGGKGIVGAKDGVAFMTYAGLAHDNPGIDPRSLEPGQTPKLLPPADPKKPDRLQRLYDWLGKDFDGLIVFDEAHLAGNAVDMRGPRGLKEASDRGKTVLDLQRLFPKARVVYSSATGATDITNLSYADRLGIWGHGTPFPTKESFFNQIGGSGLSALEIVARDLKSMGLYLARTLSFEGVTQRQLQHSLNPQQKAIYDELARAWQMVLEHRDTTMAQTGAANSGAARRDANSAFYGAQQRFYNQLLTAMQMPTVLADAKEKLASGHSLIFQLVNTNEATLNREMALKATEVEEGDTSYIDDLDLSPKRILIQYVDKSYPVALYAPRTDANGNTRWELVRDTVTNEPVKSPEALQRKQELMDKLELLKAPGNPIDMILDTFGAENVAEVTGRKRRNVNQLQPDGTRQPAMETGRTGRNAEAEAQEFQDGKRRALVMSGKGGTGFTFSASLKAKNQQRRMHYLIQAGWRADEALQGFGRSHRSAQRVAPEYILPSTDLEGHKRFISSIARRLSELGALTGGERKAAAREMFDETTNLENSYAEDAVLGFFQALYRDEIPGFNFAELTRKLGFSRPQIDPQTGEMQYVSTLLGRNGELVSDKLPPIQQFLNRILALEFDEQNKVFGEFYNRMLQRIENAKLDGSYDPGTQTLKALAIRKVGDEKVYSDPKSTAQTRLVTIEHDQPVKVIPWEDIRRVAPDREVIQYVKNIKNGRVFALKEGPSRTMDNGNVVDTWRRISPTGYDIITRGNIVTEPYYGEKPNYEEVTPEVAQRIWEDQAGKAPKTKTHKDVYVVGAFLPIWDRLRIGSPKIWRMVTDKGENILGAHVPAQSVDSLRDRLGAGGEKVTPKILFDRVMDGGQTVELANGWMVKRSRVQGDYRIEVKGVEFNQMQEFERFIGGYMERINFEPRFFIPTDEDAALPAIERILQKSPVVTKRPPSAPGAPSGTYGYFPRQSEAFGLGEQAGPPTLEQIRASRIAEHPGQLVAEIDPKHKIDPLVFYSGVPIPISLDQMKDLAGNIGQAGVKLREFWRDFAMKQAPRISDADRETGEAGVRYAVAPGVARDKGLIFAGKVLAGIKDPKFDVKLGTGISEDNLRSIKQRNLDLVYQVEHRDELIANARTEIENYKEDSANGDADAKAIIRELRQEIARLSEYEDEDAEKFQKLADGTFTFIGKPGSPFPTEEAYRQFMTSPEAKTTLERYRQMWREQKDPLFRMASDLDPDTELQTRGLDYGARINLKPVFEEAGQSKTTVGSAPRSIFIKQTATLKRKNPFSMRAEGQAPAYESSLTELLAHGFEREYPIALQHEFVRKLIESGNATLTEKESPPGLTIKGELTKGYLQKLRPWRGRFLQLPRSLAGEYEAITGLQPAARLAYYTKAAEMFTKLSITGLAEGTTHASNLLMETFTGLGPTSNPMINALLKVMGRSDLIYRLPRVIIRGFAANREEMMSLAEIGATKQPYRGTLGWFLNKIDQGSRLVSADIYKGMAENGWVDDTETGLREFVNQIGNYHKKLQPALVRWLRDTHVQPFASAIQTFNAMGLRRMVLAPGARGPTFRAKLALHADIAAGLIGFGVLVAVINYLLNQDVNGPKGTKLGAVGWIGEDGKLHQLDLGMLTGWTRGARITGFQAAVEARRAGLSGNTALMAATRSMGNTALSEVIGPLNRFATVALTGKRPGVPMVQEAQVVPPRDDFAPLRSQIAENVATGLRQASPLADAVAGFAEGKPISDIAQRQASRFTPRTGMTQETIANLPRIVKASEINEYADALGKEARKVPLAQRWQFVSDRMTQDQLNADLRSRAVIEMRKKGVFRYQ